MIRIKGGSGHTIDGGSGNDKVYVDKGAVKTIYNGGGNDYIEIGKNAGNLIKITSGNGNGKLVANETVKVLRGSKHDIRLYGGDDKVIVAGGSGHVIYTDGPTGTGDAGGNDTIVIQDGGKAKKIVAGNGNDVIAVANGAGDGTTIYTGLEDPNGKNSGTGHNTLNLLGGSGHTVYLGGEKNIVMVEAQNVTLNKYAGTDDDITVRWSEEGTGTLRINCPTGISSEQNSMLRLEGVNSVDFSYELSDMEVKTGNAYDGFTGKTSLVMKFTSMYFRDTGGYAGDGVYRVGDTANSRVAVYVNESGFAQYNWCAGNWQHNYTSTPVAASDMDSSAVIEIARWGSFKGFAAIQFDDGVKSFDQINAVANSSSHKFPSYG